MFYVVCYAVTIRPAAAKIAFGYFPAMDENEKLNRTR